MPYHYHRRCSSWSRSSSSSSTSTSSDCNNHRHYFHSGCRSTMPVCVANLPLFLFDCNVIKERFNLIWIQCERGNVDWRWWWCCLCSSWRIAPTVYPIRVPSFCNLCLVIVVIHRIASHFICRSIHIFIYMGWPLLVLLVSTPPLCPIPSALPFNPNPCHAMPCCPMPCRGGSILFIACLAQFKKKF